MGEHAVIIRIALPSSDLDIVASKSQINRLTGKLEDFLGGNDVGVFDGDEFFPGFCNLYFYGQDADLLYSSIEPILANFAICKGAMVTKRYGDVDDENVKTQDFSFSSD